MAGKQEGFGDPRGTLFFDAFRIIQEKKPKYAIMENVKGLTQKKFEFEFETMLQLLEQEGYCNYIPKNKVLNAKDYGIPQNRERVFIVSVRNDIECEFEFPEPFDNGLRLRDMLQDESEIDEKYYLSDKAIEYMDRPTRDGRTHWDFQHHNDIENDYSRCLTANLRKGVPYNILRIGSVDLNGHDICKRVYDVNGCSPTIPTGQSGNTIPKIPAKGGKIARKYTPLECFRLMGFNDEDYHKLKKHKVSDSQMYKVCGNSIVVNVIEEILKKLIPEYIEVNNTMKV